jgi:hypothetical protein
LSKEKVSILHLMANYKRIKYTEKPLYW